MPAREVLVYLGASISLACGVGLLWRRTMPIAAAALLPYLLAWLVLFRLPAFFRAPTSQETWSGFGDTGANAFQWSEFQISITLTAVGWVVADSYAAVSHARRSA